MLAGCGLASVSKNRQKTNILLILADDMGFSDARCYGGDVRTPVLDNLAANGLRFTQHYSTGRCWPSRACILSGYYAQHIRRDKMKGVEVENRPNWAKLLPEFLKHQGYRTYHSGKWHIDGSPIKGGFDRSWGSEGRGCESNRFFASTRWQEGHYTAPVKEGTPYYSTVALADHAIACLKLHAEEYSNQPFFQYLAFYSPHFPLQALEKDIESYRDAYLEGWDVIRQRRLARMKKLGIVNCELSQREPDVIPSWNLTKEELVEQIGPGEVDKAIAWDKLTTEQKHFQATKMAIHAAMLTRMDTEIARVIKQLKDMGQYENTLILFASDNGASAEQLNRGDKHDKTAELGSAKSFVCLGPGWSTAANTPFRLHKHWNHEGGIASPLIAHWPEGIKAHGQLRHDPSHFIDIAPTIMEVAGAEFPKTIDGVDVPDRQGISLVDAFAHDGSVKHDCLWWYHEGNRAIRMGDWKLSAKNNGPWELYHLKNDRSETHDLAVKYPDKVERMDRCWNGITESFRRDLGETNL
jgi:arylsulfatase